MGAAGWLATYVAALCLGSQALVSCGGHGCAAGGGEIPRPEYVGAYTGTYVRQSGTQQDLTLTLQVDALGAVTGTVEEPSSNRSALAQGRLVDWFWECQDAARVEVAFEFPGEERRELSGSAPRGLRSPWHFVAECTRESGGSPVRTGTGRITLLRQ